MFEKKNQNCSRQCTLFLIFSLLCLCFTPILAGQAKGEDSPQAVFKTAQEAAAKKDFGALAELVAPSQQPMLAFSMDMGVSMFVEFYEGEKAEELKKKYQKIQKKYKIKEEDEDEGEKLQITQDTPQEVIDEHMKKRAKKLYGHVDVAKYVPELMEVILHMPEMKEQTFFPEEKLADVKIDGNNASGKAGEKTIFFIKEGGRWYLTADVMD